MTSLHRDGRASKRLWVIQEISQAVGEKFPYLRVLPEVLSGTSMKPGEQVTVVPIEDYEALATAARALLETIDDAGHVTDRRDPRLAVGINPAHREAQHEIRKATMPLRRLLK